MQQTVMDSDVSNPQETSTLANEQQAYEPLSYDEVSCLYICSL